MFQLRLIALISCLVCFSAVVDGAEKYALLVAVAKYGHSGMNQPEPLRYPEEDAKALGKTLKASGYEVELLLGQEAKREVVSKKLEGLTKKADAEGVVLVGLFGHGVEIETFDEQHTMVMEGCFCPFDTDLRIVKDAKGQQVFDKNQQPLTEPDPATLVKLSDVMMSLKLAKAGNRVVLADCCRTVPNQARGRSFGAGFRAQDLPSNTSVLFGCSPNERAFEHQDWGHGAFTKCLLEGLTELSAAGSVETANLAVHLKRKVPSLVANVSPKDRQTPKIFGTDSVDLQLISTAPAKPPTSTPPEPTSPDPTPPPTKQSNYPGPFAGGKAGERKELVPGINFRWCPVGEFKMGITKVELPTGAKPPAEEEAVEVTLTQGFWLAETEVTQSQWQKLMGTTPWNGQPKVKQGKNIAASYLSYEDAIQFCEKLTTTEHDAGRLHADWKYQLPTEAQWEYACRSRTATKYSFGNDISKLGDYAWFKEITKISRDESVHPVGEKKPNDWGLYDMHGNLMEWCLDWYEEKLTGGIDPAGSSSGSRRVVRGGGWNNVAQSCRAASRSHRSPNNRISELGLRVAAVFVNE